MRKIMRPGLLLLTILSFNCFAQEQRYFTAYFQKMTDERTAWERVYTFGEGQTLIEDIKDNHVIHKATLYGLTEIDQVNEYAWYCISRGTEFYYRDYFVNARASFEVYERNMLMAQLIISGNKFRYAQVWNREGNEVLVNGSGTNTYLVDEEEETIVENYKDSVQVLKYGVRTKKRDTIYYTTDKLASPKEGFPAFYQYIQKAIKYPRTARRAGAEGKVYIQFIVDEKGRLSDFKPLTNEGYRLEARTISRLEGSPDWNPAVYSNRPVKSKFIVPITFALTD